MQKPLKLPSVSRAGVGLPTLGPYSTRFCHAADAWFWAVAALASRRDGCRTSWGIGIMRPCEPDDVMKCVDQLYQNRRITIGHARVLLKWGRRRVAPSNREPTEVDEARLWDEALVRLAWVLRAKGIIA